MNKRIAKKVYLRTAFHGAFPWSPRLTDREKTAHRIWWKTFEAFGFNIPRDASDDLKAYFKGIKKTFNRVSFKDAFMDAQIQMALYGGAVITVFK